MNEVSVKRKGSSLREGQGVERTVCEEESRSFWRGKVCGEDDGEGRESSRDSANWITKGSEKVACGKVDCSETLILLGLALGFGVSLGFLFMFM